MARQTYSGFGGVDYSDLSGGAYLLADKKELERLNSVSGQKAMSTDFKGQNGNSLKRQQKVSRSKLKEVEKQQSDFE